MATRTVIVGTATGLHARPAALVADAVAEQPVEVRIGTAKRSPVPVRGPLSVVVLGALHGTEIILEADDGPEAESALDTVAALLAKDLDAESETPDQPRPETTEATGGEAASPGTPPRPPVRMPGGGPAEPSSEATAGPLLPPEPPDPETEPDAPETLHGIGVSPGLAAGPVCKLAPPPQLPAPVPVTDTDAEKTRATAALSAVAATLRSRAADTGGAAADILNAEAMIVEDPMLTEAIETNLDKGMDAPHAIDAAITVHREAFAAAGGFLAERVTDLDDLRNRAIAHCLDQPDPGIPEPGHPFILVAADLAPADTAGLDPATVLALVTEGGGPTSHTAILARAAGLPAVVGCPGVLELPDDTLISVDGTLGSITVDIDESEVARVETAEHSRRQAEATATGPGRTADGHPVALLANIGSAADLPADGDYEGVGLFRTELLYLDRTTAPGKTEQSASYREVFAALGDRPIVVRTLDSGADKPLPFLAQTGEPNPALGIRGLRLARQQPNILDTQLSAIAEAAADTGADVRVMAPMVSTIAEAADFAARARWAGVDKVGVMVEVPAIALLAEELVDVVDFLSIGSNDLSQYLFAADRQSSEMADLLDPAQPALLRLIARCAEAGAATGTPVGVCGEAAARPDLAVVLTGLGVTSLSMSGRSLPAVRHALSQHTMEECRDLGGAALRGSLVRD